MQAGSLLLAVNSGRNREESYAIAESLFSFPPACSFFLSFWSVVILSFSTFYSFNFFILIFVSSWVCACCQSFYLHFHDHFVCLLVGSSTRPQQLLDSYMVKITWYAWKNSWLKIFVLLQSCLSFNIPEEKVHCQHGFSPYV